MKIDTLGDFVKQLSGTPTEDTLTARARLYQAMSEYMDAAINYAKQGGTESREEYVRKAGRLAEVLLSDARAHLSDEKYSYLLTHNIQDDGEPYKVNRADLVSAIDYQWGSEDMFMFRLSSGLPGSYVKALVGLKGQARFAGYTIPQLLSEYLKNRKV